MRTPNPWNIPDTPFRLEHVAPMGVTRQRLASAARHGLIVRLREGVYVDAGSVPEEPESLHLLRALAEQVVVSDLVASHGTAALAHGLPLLSTASTAAGPLRFTRACEPRLRSRSSDRHRITLAQLPAHHVMRLASGLVVTTPARTTVDLARDLPAPECLMLMDAALRLELAELAGGLRRGAYRERRLCDAAAAPLREAVTHAPASRRAMLTRLVELADVRRESPLESFSAGYFMVAGIPRPVHQARISTPVGDFYPDNLWEEYRVIGEADGEGKYADPKAVISEKVRDGALRDLGYEVVHWPGAAMWRRPAAVTARVARVLVAAGWDGAPHRWA